MNVTFGTMNKIQFTTTNHITTATPSNPYLHTAEEKSYLTAQSHNASNQECAIR